MDKSSSAKKNIGHIERRSKVFVFIFPVCFLILLFTQLNALYAEAGRFRIVAKDLNLVSLESLLDKHSPKIKYDGKISLSADIKLEAGLETISNGFFSSDKVSFSSENFLFPLEVFQLEGEFIINTEEETLPVIAGKIKSALLKWGKLPAQNLKADYELHEKILVIKNGEVEIAGGTAHISGNIDFNKNPAVFNLKLVTQGVDIGIVSQQGGGAHAISGILFADADLSGEIGKPESISGEAKVKIENGELGKVGLIGRVLTFSPLAAISRDFSLHVFEGDFAISGGYAYTENAILRGPEIRIAAKGDVGWNKKLNFLLGLYASSELLGGTSLTRTLGTIIDASGNVLRRIRLTGTIDNPAFTIVPLGIGEAIVEGLERTFGRDQQEKDIK